MKSKELKANPLLSTIVLDTTHDSVTTLVSIAASGFHPVPTRQTSSSGRSKSPRIQVVLPEGLWERLSAAAEADSRTVSNMAKVLIQQGLSQWSKLPTPKARASNYAISWSASNKARLSVYGDGLAAFASIAKGAPIAPIFRSA